MTHPPSTNPLSLGLISSHRKTHPSSQTPRRLFAFSTSNATSSRLSSLAAVLLTLLLLASLSRSTSLPHGYTQPQAAFALPPQSQLQAQSQSQPQPQPQPQPSSLTLIDLLAASPAHSTLLHLIQRARLVPVINLLNSSTLFAPSNDALDRLFSNQSLLLRSSHSDHLPDNLQLKIRHTILYHLLNFTLPAIAPTESPDMLETLLIPMPPGQSASPGQPVLPGLLGGHGQRLPMIRRKDTTYISVDGDGQDGIALPPPSAFQNATNGILVPIDDVLIPPRSLAELITSTPTLSVYASILSQDFLNQLHSVPHLTLFAPVNDAWDGLSAIEMAYLRSNFSSDDSLKIFRAASSASVLGPQQVGYSSLLRHKLLDHTDKPLFIDAADGNALELGIDDKSNHLTINGSEILKSDLLASNGVLHLVPRLLLPPGEDPLGMTAEKYLLASNCTRFVELFRAANLSTQYLGNSSARYTILAPRDDALQSPTHLRWSSLVETNKTSDTVVSALRYHVVQGKYLADDLEDGMLVRTELMINGTKGLSQRISVSVSANDGKGASDSKRAIIGFGGVNVVGGEPVQIGETVIYMISQVIEPPADLLQVALSDIRLSTCVASIFAAKLEVELKALAGLTFLVPTNKAFAELGLIMDYLLLEKSKADLAQVLKYHALREVVYLQDLKVGSSGRFPTLEGTEIYVTKLAAHNVTLHGPTVGGVPLNGETQDSGVVNKKDVLIENGSMELINLVELPPGVNIDLKKLMLGAKAATMLDLVQASSLNWILDHSHGHKPAAERDGDSEINLAKGFTILSPTDDAFTKINLTYYLEDRTRLDLLVRQHIIPTAEPGSSNDLDGPEPEPFKPLYMSDGIVYSTLLSRRQGGPSAYGDVSFRMNTGSESHGDDDDEDDGGHSGFKGRWLVGIKGARGSDGHHDSARLLNYGRASPKVVTGSKGGQRIAPGGGVMSLDRVLEPYEPSVWERWAKYVVAWSALACLAAGLGFFVWRVWSKKRSGNGVGGYHYIEPMEE